MKTMFYSPVYKNTVSGIFRVFRYIKTIFLIILFFSFGCSYSESEDLQNDYGTVYHEIDVVPFFEEPAGCMVFYNDNGPHTYHRDLGTPYSGNRRTIFMNRHGGTYIPASYNDSSQNYSIIPRHTSTIPPFHGSDEAWEAIMECMQGAFARWNVLITDQDPGNAVHIESVIGGNPSNLGLSGNVAGISPFGCQGTQGRVIERSIAFTFSGIMSSVTEVCGTAAHEVGHSLGLDHVHYCPDHMSYLHGCGAKAFRDYDAQCGEWQTRQCHCGTQTLNTYQHLDNVLGLADQGPDTEPPSINVLLPSDNTLAANSNLRIQAVVEDNREVASVILNWHVDGEIIDMDCANPPDLVECSGSWNTYTWRFPVAEGQRAFTISAMDGSGNQAESPLRNIVFDPAISPSPYGIDVELLQPADGATIRPGQSMTVQARITPYGGATVVRARVKWLAGDGQLQIFDLGLENQANHLWEITLGLSSQANEGERWMQVEAEDESGEWTFSDRHTVYVSR